MRWYISVAAVLEYQVIMGGIEEPDGPGFDRAEYQLAELCEIAQRVNEQRPEPHRELYRVKTTIRGKPTRLELTVSLKRRPEGDLPQLVRVRDKGR